MTISVYSEKAFRKTQNPHTIKNSQKNGNKREFP